MGAKDNPYPFMKQADIYVHATRFEGKSIAIEEAQILGKTIVASDCTGNTEQIKSGYDGVLLTLNVENLVRELERLIDEPGLQKEYAKHVLEKKLEYPKDLESMLALLKEEKEGSYE
jgi:glycosyltransferase involved in cell wall biosynthesis